MLHNTLECYKICIIYIENGPVYLSNMVVYFKNNSFIYKIILYSQKTLYYILIVFKKFHDF